MALISLPILPEKGQFHWVKVETTSHGIKRYLITSKSLCNLGVIMLKTGLHRSKVKSRVCSAKQIINHSQCLVKMADNFLVLEGEIELGQCFIYNFYFYSIAVLPKVWTRPKGSIEERFGETGLHIMKWAK